MPLMTAVRASKDDNIIYNDSGSIYYRSQPCSVAFDRETFSVFSKDKNNKLLIEYPSSSLIGMKIQPLQSKKGKSYQADFFFYPPRSSLFCALGGGNCTETRRSRKVLSLVFQTDENIPNQWASVIQSYVSGNRVARLRDGTEPVVPSQRHFLVVVNPKSGKGEAMKIWKKTIQPMLMEAGIKATVLVTERPHHAHDYVVDPQFVPDDVEAVVVIGGDGVLYEVVNGLSEREDGMSVLNRLALAPIPGGTGNGLIKSILHQSQEVSTPINAAYCAIRGSTAPLDLSEVITKSGNRHLSFLSLTWGLIADIDILSESMRFLGESRLYLSAGYFVATKRFYEGILRMKLVDPTAYSSRESQGTCTDSIAVDVDKKPTSKKPIVPTEKINKLKEGESLDEEGWLSLHSRFMMVFVAQTSHCSTSVHSGPGVKLDDGFFTVYAVEHISRFELSQLLLSFDSGEFVNHKSVRVFKCSEYSLEPLTKSGRYSLDGELIEYDRIEAKMLPGAARVKVLM